MKKYRLYVIRKMGSQYRRVLIRFSRDAVTGEYSVSLFGFHRMLMVCMEKVIPGLSSLISSY